MIRVFVVGAGLALLGVQVAEGAEAAAAATGEDSDRESGGAAPVDPTILLIRSAAVREELELTAEQRTALDQLLSEHNRMLLAIRDVGPTGADESAQPALTTIRGKLKALLTSDQKTRLRGLVLQAQGYDALLRRDVARLLQLTPDQLADLTTIGDDVHAQLDGLRESAGGREPGELQQELERLQADRHKRVVAVLNADQQNAYGKLLGEPFNLSLVKPSPADAPEFESIEEWFNSEPLTMEGLRGQVVVVHFFAFGCSNCINNYPWYREWHAAYAGKGVTLIGIHTPETEPEANNELLRKSLETRELKFPVAVDKQKAMWTAWYNGIWPSVYLVDKQGRVRFWWYGELDWQGAGNQKVARGQIDQLLAEPYEPVEPRAEAPAGGGR